MESGGGEKDQGYYGMKNEASYRNADLNIPMQRQANDAQAYGQQSFERERTSFVTRINEVTQRKHIVGE